MHNIKNKKDTHLSKKKRILFKLTLLFIPLLFFTMFEITLRVFNYGGNRDLFIPASSPYTNYKKCNPLIAKRYFFIQSTLPQPSNDIFLTQKPENGYRIFVLGGSTALGFPYGNLLMFSRILHRRLEDTFPEKRIEIVNVALTAVNSYTLLDVMDEILQEKPDAILIYAGHNEYYGAMGVASLEAIGRQRWVVLSYLKLNHFKVFVLLKDTINKIMKFSQKYFQKHEYNPSGTLMERLVTKQRIPGSSKLYRRGKKQFKRNLRAICLKAQKAGIPILISELVSNVRDLKPFISEKANIDLSAEQVYLKAKQLEKQKKYEYAKKMYYQAKDLDALRFRAPEDFNSIIHQVADEVNVPVVFLKSFFENVSQHGLIGDNLMVDHLHPNIEGYFLMADAFYETMRSQEFIAEQWDSNYIKPASNYRDNWPITEIDTTVASLIIRQLKGSWPFKPKFTENRMLLDFQPKSLVESLALKVIFNEISIDEAHFSLAKYYENKKDIRRATKEYDALSYLVFIEAYSYLNRAKILFKAKKYDLALNLLLESLKSEQIPLAYRLAGEIYLEKGNAKKAVVFLENAQSKIPTNPDLLYILCIAYFKNKQFEKANQSYKYFKLKFPDDTRIDHIKSIIGRE